MRIGGELFYFWTEVEASIKIETNNEILLNESGLNTDCVGNFTHQVNQWTLSIANNYFAYQYFNHLLLIQIRDTSSEQFLRHSYWTLLEELNTYM